MSLPAANDVLWESPTKDVKILGGHWNPVKGATPKLYIHVVNALFYSLYEGNLINLQYPLLQRLGRTHYTQIYI